MEPNLTPMPNTLLNSGSREATKMPNQPNKDKKSAQASSGKPILSVLSRLLQPKTVPFVKEKDWKLSNNPNCLYVLESSVEVSF